MTNGNHQAFGFGYEKTEINPRYGRGSSEQFLKDTVEYKGLTKREMAVFMAMQGLCTKGVPPNWQDLEVKKSWVEWVGEMSCEIADQTINELNKPTT